MRAAHPSDLMAVLPAAASSLHPARGLLRDWLSEQEWPVPAAEDIELAVHEAISDAIDHAHAPTVSAVAGSYALGLDRSCYRLSPRHRRGYRPRPLGRPSPRHSCPAHTRPQPDQLSV